MANYRKSFNFRNGVQVDTDNFIANSLGLVVFNAGLNNYGVQASTNGLTYAGVTHTLINK